jgi:hypothetical protein
MSCSSSCMFHSINPPHGLQWAVIVCRFRAPLRVIMRQPCWAECICSDLCVVDLEAGLYLSWRLTVCVRVIWPTVQYCNGLRLGSVIRSIWWSTSYRGKYIYGPGYYIWRLLWSKYWCVTVWNSVFEVFHMTHVLWLHMHVEIVSASEGPCWKYTCVWRFYLYIKGCTCNIVPASV